MKILEDYTDEELATTANVLQTLDVEAELFFNTKHAKEFHNILKVSESDVAELAKEFNEITAPNILLMDSCGYRIVLSTFVNVLIAMERKDIATKIMSFREEEEI
tara:strand:- start:140 stop:454 length:315 start_codon:yes stop_codon:yes gene_type:complete